MLFRSLIDRLLGTNEFRNSTDLEWVSGSTKISYDKYPTLPGLLVQLLATESLKKDMSALGLPRLINISVHAVFAALEFLRRAGPPAKYHGLVKKLVFDHLGNCVWHVRDLAARTYCAFVPDNLVIMEIRALFNVTLQYQNAVHGRLLTVKHVLNRCFAPKAQASIGISSDLYERWRLMELRNHSSDPGRS